MCFTIRHGKRLGETLKLPQLSTSVSEAATSRLGLVSVSKTWISGLVSVSAQKVSCTSLNFYSAIKCVYFPNHVSVTHFTQQDLLATR